MRENKTSAAEGKNKEGSTQMQLQPSSGLSSQEKLLLSLDRKSCVRLPMNKKDHILGSHVLCSLKSWSFVDRGISRWLLDALDRTFVFHDSKGMGPSGPGCVTLVEFQSTELCCCSSEFWLNRQMHHNALLFWSHIFSQPFWCGRAWQYPVAAAPNSPSFTSPVGFSSSSGKRWSRFLSLHAYGFAFCWAEDHAGTHVEFVLLRCFPAPHVQKLVLSLTFHSDAYIRLHFSELRLLYDLPLSREVGKCLLHSYEEYFSYLQQNCPGDFCLDCTFWMFFSIIWV